jgi:hypothetical protein
MIMDDDQREALLAEGIATDDWDRRHEIAHELAARRPDVALPLVQRLFARGDDGAVALGGDLIKAGLEWGAEEHAERRAAVVGLVVEQLATAGEVAACCLVRGTIDIAEPELLVPILARVADPSEEVRFAVATTLPFFSDFDQDATDAALLRLAQDEDEDVVDWAIFGLGVLRGDANALDTPEARAIYEANVDHEHEGIQDEARAALALLGHIEYLEDCLWAEDADGARRVGDSFVIAAGRTGDPRLHPSLVTLRELGWATGNVADEAMLVAALEATRPAAT